MFVDIGIAVVILICFIVGIARGSLKTFLSIGVIVGGLLLSAWLTGMLASWIRTANPEIYRKFIEFCVSDEKAISLVKIFQGCNIDYTSSKTLTAIYQPMLNMLEGLTVLDSSSQVVGLDVIMPILMSLHLGMLIVLFVVYLAVTIILEIVAHIIKAIVKGKSDRKPNGFSRFMGALFGIINGAIIACIIMVVASAVVPVPALTDPMTSQTNNSFVYTTTMPAINNVIEEKIISKDLILDALDASGYFISYPAP